MIPKRIFSIWLNCKSDLPAIVERCIASHKLAGYEHHFISLDNCYRNQYINDCIEAENWVSASDFLRFWYLYHQGGIYCDADLELYRHLDQFLNDFCFAGKAPGDILNTAIIGTERYNPVFKEIYETIETFNGKDTSITNIMEAGMKVWASKIKGLRIYPPDYFYPWDNIGPEIQTPNFTENTHSFHHGLQSWHKGFRWPTPDPEVLKLEYLKLVNSNRDEKTSSS